MENSNPIGTEPLTTETIKNPTQAVDYLLKTNEPSQEDTSEDFKNKNDDVVEEHQNTSEDEDQTNVNEDNVSEETLADQSDDVVNTVEEEQELVQEEPERYSVLVDGKSQNVTLDELKSGYQRQSDYTKKTQNLAEQRKNFESQNNFIQQERALLAENLKATQQFLEQGMVQPPDSNLIESDPTTYMRQKDAFEKHQTALNMVKNEQISLQQKQQQELVENYKKNLAEEQVRLTELIPEWKNGEVATKEKQNIVTYAKRMGFSDNELATASDSRAIAVLRNAYLYDQLVSKNKVVQKKVNKAPKMVKGGVPKNKNEIANSNSQKLFDKLKKSGRQEDALNYLLSKQT